MAVTDRSDDRRMIPVHNWASIIGHWRFEDSERILYREPPAPEFPWGLCVANVRFVEGEARVTILQEHGPIDGRVVLGYRSLEHEFFLVGLGGYGNAYTVTHFIPGVGWRRLIGAGNTDDLVAGKPYLLSVLVRGQRIALEVDSVRVFEYVLPTPVPFGQLGLFAWGEGGTEFSNVLVQEERGLGDVFVVMQFTGFEELYTDVIVPVTEHFGLRPYRADEVYGPGNILADIVVGIQRLRSSLQRSPRSTKMFSMRLDMLTPSRSPPSSWPIRQRNYLST
jgi:hypothetical protein